MIAYEIAQQLIAQGKIVNGLYLLDTRALPIDIWRKSNALTSNSIRQLLLNVYSGVTGTQQEQERLLQRADKDARLLEHYRIKPLSSQVPLTVFRAMECERSTDARLDVYYQAIHQLSNTDLYTWEHYSDNLLQYDFATTHQLIMTEPWIEKVVEAIVQ